MARFFAYPFGIAGTRTPIAQTPPGGGVLSYEGGYTVNYEQDLATISTALPIDRGSFNELMYETTLAIQQYQTLSIYDWIPAAATFDGNPYPYDIYARVRYNVGSPGTPGAGNLVYENQVQGNTATPGADATWLVISGGYQGVPVGTVIDFAGTTAPAGYLKCDGTEGVGGNVSRTTYAALFAAIGTTWGVGDGTTTFGLPNLTRRTKINEGGTGTAVIGNAVGDLGGAETITQAANQVGQHTHTINAFPTFVGVSVPPGNFQAYTSGAGYSVVAATPQTGAPSGGATQPMANMQPSAVVLMCIKY